MPVSKRSRPQRTTAPPQNDNERKLCSQQRVENNRKDIVKAGHKMKTLRAMKAEKRKKNQALYFIQTEASVDNTVHWEEIQCGALTDVDGDSDHSTGIVKVSKNKIESDSESSEGEMFPPDDDNPVDDAAASAANAAKELLHSPLLERHLNTQYGDENIAYTGHVECFEKEHEEDSAIPNFDVILHELDKINTCQEVLDVKARILKLKEALSIHDDHISVNLDTDDIEPTNTEDMKPAAEVANASDVLQHVEQHVEQQVSNASDVLQHVEQHGIKL